MSSSPNGKRRLLNAFDESDSKKQRLAEESLLNEYLSALANDPNFPEKFNTTQVIASLCSYSLDELMDAVGGLDGGYQYGCTTVPDMLLLNMQGTISKHLLDHRQLTIDQIVKLFKLLDTHGTTSFLASSMILKALPHLTGEQRGTCLALLLDDMFDDNTAPQHLAILYELIAHWDPSMAVSTPSICAMLIEGGGTIGAVKAMAEKLTVDELIHYNVFNEVTRGGSRLLLINHSAHDLLSLLTYLHDRIITKNKTVPSACAMNIIAMLGNYAPAVPLCTELCKNQATVSDANKLRTAFKAKILSTELIDTRIAYTMFYLATLDQPADIDTAWPEVIALQKASPAVPLNTLLAKIIETATRPQPSLDLLEFMLTMFGRYTSAENHHSFFGDRPAQSETGTSFLQEVCAVIESLMWNENPPLLSKLIIATIEHAQLRGSVECVGRMLMVLKDCADLPAFKTPETFTCLLSVIINFDSENQTLFQLALDVFGDLMDELVFAEAGILLLQLYDALLHTAPGQNTQALINFIGQLAPSCLSSLDVRSNNLVHRLLPMWAAHRELNFQNLTTAFIDIAREQETIGDVAPSARPTVCKARLARRR